jgi:hypothetical protein
MPSPALFEPHKVFDADASQLREFLAAQTRRAPP